MVPSETLTNPPLMTPICFPRPSGGRVVVYGDSNCMDSAHLQKDCFWLLTALLEVGEFHHQGNNVQN
jgi:hypothetical protein